MARFYPLDHSSKRILRRYTLVGWGVGIMIAVVAWLVTPIRHTGILSLGTIWSIHVDNHLTWLIYLVPIILTLLARELGRRTLAEAELRQQRDFLHQILDTMGEGVTVTKKDGSFSFVNRAYAAMIGTTPEALLAQTPYDLILPSDHHLLRTAHQERQQGKSSVYEMRLCHTDKSFVYGQIHAVPYYQGGQFGGSIVVTTNITERLRLQRALQHEHDFVKTILETMESLVIVLDRDGRIMRFNRACEMLTGYSRDELIGQYFWHYLVPEDQIAGVRAIFDDLCTHQLPNAYENHWRTRSGDIRLISWSNATLLNEEGTLAYIIGTGIDITEMRQLEQRREALIVQLHDQATTDNLTGLHNRGYFLAQAEQVYARAQTNNDPVSALMLDIDYFKRVNDNYGHAVGDEVLRVVADRCRASLRDADIIGRIGGEEIAIILPQVAKPESLVVAERIWRTLADAPVVTEIGPLAITISVGVTTSTEHTHTLADLLHHADIALYNAKDNGRNQVSMLLQASESVVV